MKLKKYKSTKDQKGKDDICNIQYKNAIISYEIKVITIIRARVVQVRKYIHDQKGRWVSILISLSIRCFLPI